MPTKELRVIRHISEIIAETTDYRESLRRAVECIADELRVGACSLFVYDETLEKLVMEANYGLGQGVVRRIRLSPGEGITGYSFQAGQLINVPDKTRHPRFKPFRSRRAEDFRALLVVPLTVGTRTIGVMGFERERARRFGSKMVGVAQAIASPLAVFILNAKLAQDVGKTLRPGLKRQAETRLHGKAITDGMVRGRAHFLPGAEILDVVEVDYADDPASEEDLLAQALEVARDETRLLQQEADKILAEADAAIFSAHMLLLEDPTLIQRIHQALSQGFTLRFALRIVAEEFNKEMELLDSDFMRERLVDIKDVILRVYEALDRLEGGSSQKRRTYRSVARAKSIIVAKELLASQLMRVPQKHLAGIICEHGGTTTHAAILAKALRIPMLVGVDSATKEIETNDDLILDCSSGCCYVRPSPALVRRFRKPISRYHAKTAAEPEVPAQAALTADGTPIRLAGNISLISELPYLHQYGAMGIGLYRTEFMFMIRAAYPTEDEQYAVFRQLVESADNQPVSIRLLDAGGDKPLPYIDFGQEENTFLGWRGIRFLIDSPQYLRPHLRAILRTTPHGNVWILLPMVADLDELLAICEALEEARASLDRDGLPYADHKLGIMVEVPAAVWGLPDMLPYIDFVSLGTNDLTQHAFALDRGNSKVAHWFRQYHPILLRMIRQTCEVVNNADDIELAICGEIASAPMGAPLLLGLGLRTLSMSPWRIPAIREAISHFSISECEALAEEALHRRRDAQVAKLINQFADEHGLRSKNLDT